MQHERLGGDINLWYATGWTANYYLLMMLRITRFCKSIQGPQLMQVMEAQAMHGANLVYDYVERVELVNGPFRAFTSSGVIYEADTVIICTGAKAKWLGLKSEQKFQEIGVSGLCYL